MKDPHDLRRYVIRRVRRSFWASGLSYEQLSIRSGCSVRTVERVLTGATCNPTTISAISAVLAIDWTRAEPGEESV